MEKERYHGQLRAKSARGTGGGVAANSFHFTTNNNFTECTHYHWPSDACCSPYTIRKRLDRWTQLLGMQLPVPKPWLVEHVDLIEPLTVAAFAAAIDRWMHSGAAGGFVVDISTNAGFYTWLASAIAPKLRLIGVDMQPTCIEVAECGLRLMHRRKLNGNMPAKAHLLRRYVSNGTTDPTLYVCRRLGWCRVAASPTDIQGQNLGKANQ